MQGANALLTMWRVPLVAALSCGGAAIASAQSVAIAPQTIVVSSKTNAGSVTLVNQGNTPAEVSLSMSYGFPDTDTSGKMFLRMFDTVPAAAPSVARWVQIFPQKLRLAPKARRTIRLMIVPPKQLAPGEYWGRLTVSVRGGRLAAHTGSDTSIRIGLSLEVRSVLPLLYRNGAVSTGLRIDTVRAVQTGDSLVARPTLTRTGTAAYIGTVQATLRDSRGTAVSQGKLLLGVYYTMTPRIPVSVRKLPPGIYTLTISAVSSRPDVSPALLLRAQPVQTTIPVTLR